MNKSAIIMLQVSSLCETLDTIPIYTDGEFIYLLSKVNYDPISNELELVFKTDKGKTKDLSQLHFVGLL